MTFRSAAHLAIVRLVECSNCESPPPNEAAHSNLLRHGKGKGIKASDAASFAACHTCHAAFDQGKHLTKQEREALTHEYISKTVIRLIERGLLVPAPQRNH